VRAVALAVFLVSVVAFGGALEACRGGDAEGQPTPSGSAPEPGVDEQQARFDHERRPEEVVKAAGIKPGMRVADIGAGAGLMTTHLARAVKPGGHVVATDIDAEVFQLMTARLKANGLEDLVERRVVSADAPGLEANTYDAIILGEVDHLFADPVAWLKAAIGALKPDGRLVISNRIHHRKNSLMWAAKAGLVLKTESSPMPTHFIAVFGPPAAGSK
jgi:2-polyprenyl-3-methyl-5-hydroxy-6-metoxy-1,4-benzoquinol methylase